MPSLNSSSKKKMKFLNKKLPYCEFSALKWKASYQRPNNVIAKSNLTG